MDAEGEGRIKLFLIAPELVLLMGSGTCEVIANPLPADTKIVRPFYSDEYHSFAIIVTSREFEMVIWGERIPILESPVIRRLT